MAVGGVVGGMAVGGGVGGEWYRCGRRGGGMAVGGVVGGIGVGGVVGGMRYPLHTKTMMVYCFTFTDHSTFSVLRNEDACLIAN